MTTARATTADLEARTRELGSHILTRARAAHPRSREETLINRVMTDPRARVQLLRFVDVLPTLADDADIVRHLDEYLGDDHVATVIPGLSSFPGLTRWGLRHAHGGIAAHVVAAAVRLVVHRMANRFIAGADARTVARRLERLHRRGMGFTLDLLGEATVSEPEADAYRDQYLALLRDLPAHVRHWPAPGIDHVILPTPRLNLSVKVSALDPQIDPAAPRQSIERIAARLRPILAAARDAGAFVNLDMEQYDYKGLTLRLFMQLLAEDDLRGWPDVGIAMQAYLRDAPEDLAQLIAWSKRRGTPVTVRLVRGAYWDYENVIARQNNWPIPVWTQKSDTDRCYEACTQMLLESHQHVRPAIGTHNVRSIAHAMVLVESLGLTPRDLEFQMLYGMAEPIKDVVVGMGYPLRVYVPFGEIIPGMAYLVRRLLENTSSQSFLRMSFTGEADPAQLLASPLETSTPDENHSGDSAPHSFHEPVHRFTQETERASLGEVIAAVKRQLGGDYPLLIAGRARGTPSTITSINPALPAQVVGRCGSASAQDAADAVAAADDAFEKWADLGFGQRAQTLLRAADLMAQRRDELAAWQILEAGKTWKEADADVCEAIDFLRYYAQQAQRLALGHDLSAPGESDRYLYEPRGPTAVIAPWNFPLAIPAGMTSAALVAGNSVVLKPAPQTPVIAAKLVEILVQAGLPPGVLNYLPGGDEAGAALVSDPRIHVIAFTGSEAVGQAIYAEGARVQRGQDHLKRVIAEMGGKNAIIVDSDADLDEAVRGVVASAFGHQGQKCSACSRAIVVGGAYEGFLKRLCECAAGLRLGPPEDPANFMGPIIDDVALASIRRAVEEGRKVARVALEVPAPPGDGYYMGPVIFADVPPDSALAQNEIFGPVLAVLRARDFAHALELANHSRYALTGGVYSRSPANLEAARRRFRVGNLYLNRKITGAVVGRQPFGGFKMSGVGSRAGGPDYLLQFLEPRTITENTIRRGFAADADPPTP